MPLLWLRTISDCSTLRCRSCLGPFTSIQHPSALLAHPDIPSFAWGKFRDGAPGRLQLPFSVQAHHGFVDGFHIHQIAQQIAAELEAMMR